MQESQHKRSDKEGVLKVKELIQPLRGCQTKGCDLLEGSLHVQPKTHLIPDDVAYNTSTFPPLLPTSRG